MLIKHLRDELKNPFGTIVAISQDRIGVSICNLKDNFDKKRGIQIALGRAKQQSIVDIPNRTVCLDDYLISMVDVVDVEVIKMFERSCKYFKKEGAICE